MEQISTQIVYLISNLLENIHFWEATHEIEYKIAMDKERKRLEELINQWHELKDDAAC